MTGMTGKNGCTPPKNKCHKCHKFKRSKIFAPFRIYNLTFVYYSYNWIYYHYEVVSSGCFSKLTDKIYNGGSDET